MNRYKQQDGGADLIAAATQDFAINPENTCLENIALWVNTTAICVWTVYALINGVQVSMGTGNTTANKPVKVFTEAGPYPLYHWPLSLNINNSTSGVKVHVEYSFNALVRSGYQ